MNNSRTNSPNCPLVPINALEEIAKRHLDLETLEERGRDALDFYDCAVWPLKAALKDAYFLGYGDGRRICGPVFALTRDQLDPSCHLTALKPVPVYTLFVEDLDAIGYDVSQMTQEQLNQIASHMARELENQVIQDMLDDIVRIQGIPEA